MRDRPPAVVLSADINGLGAVRSLHRAGIASMILVTSRGEIARTSRLPVKCLIAEGANDAAVLAALADAPDGAVLIPTSDWYVAFLERNAAALGERFRWCRLPDGVSALLIDKATETDTMRRLGIPIPRTVHPLPESAEALIAALGPAIIIKPRSWEYSKALGRKNVTTGSLKELEAWWPKLAPVRDAVVAQELIPGEDAELWVCNCCFDHDHRVLGEFTFQRLGTSPAHVGVTTFALSVRNPRVSELVARIGSALKYVGPAMIEFKRDPRTGEYLYLETNPRIGMCNWFDTSSGVNNVALSYRVALGESGIAPAPVQSEHTCYLDRLDDSYARRHDGASWPVIFREWRRSRGRRVVGPYFARHDPGPGLHAVGRRLSALGRAATRRLGLRK